MLTITSLNEFRAAIAHKKELRETEIAPGLISFCYMISDNDTFDTPEARECRGIVFDQDTGAVVCRPLHKFFNLGEREDTRLENLPDDIRRIMDKRDGSMINTVRVGDSFRLKSKKTFESEVARAATALVDLPENEGLSDLCHYIAHGLNSTATFEYTSPDAKIVLPYKSAELRLLHVRHNETGEYWNFEVLKSYCQVYGVGLVDENTTDSIPDLLEQAKTTTGVEGWIAQFANGDMVKIKTDWYLTRHHAMTDLRERDVAQLVLDEELDDIKAMLVADGVDINDILQIEARVVQQLLFIRKEVEAILAIDGKLDRKTFATCYRDHKYFGLLMAGYTGKDPKYTHFFEQWILRADYALRSLNLPDRARADAVEEVAEQV
jgi:RNA ligase